MYSSTLRSQIRALCALAAVAAFAVTGVAPAAGARSTGTIAYIERPITLRAVSADGRVDKLFARARNPGGNGPVWSPDGRRLLLHRDDPHALVSITPGSGRAKELYAPQDDVAEAPSTYAWSPDGRQIALTHGVVQLDGLGGVGLFVMAADGSGKREVVVGGQPVSFLGWHDARRLAVLRFDNVSSSVWTVDVVTGSLAKLFDVTADAGNLSLSPDRRWWSFTRALSRDNAELWIMRADGTGARRIKSGRLGGENAWSPDSRELAIVLRSGNKADIYKIRRDGSGLERLTRSGKAREPSWGRGKLRKRGAL